MRPGSIILRLLAALRPGLALAAALSFVLSSMVSIHTAHALAGGHDRLVIEHAAPQGAASHCDQHEQQAPEAQKDKAFSCCAFACAPPVLVSQPPVFRDASRHGDPLAPATQAAILDRAIAGLFRPPRSLA